MMTWALTFVTIWFSVPVHLLTLTDLSDDTFLFSHAVTPGDTFKTVYLHSLELTPVWEYFRIDDHYEIVLTDTIYESSGAGLPIPEYGRDVVTKKGNQFHISAINRHLPSILLRVNTEYNNIFFFNDTIQLNLSNLAGNSVVKIETERKALLIIIYRDVKRLILH